MQTLDYTNKALSARMLKAFCTNLVFYFLDKETLSPDLEMDFTMHTIGPLTENNEIILKTSKASTK